jgi:hypothetical protein
MIGKLVAIAVFAAFASAVAFVPAAVAGGGYGQSSPDHAVEPTETPKPATHHQRRPVIHHHHK